MLSRKGFDAENISDLRGLNERSPWMAAMMMLIIFSMAGVPPTVGFFAKLFKGHLESVKGKIVGVQVSTIHANYVEKHVSANDCDFDCDCSFCFVYSF